LAAFPQDDGKEHRGPGQGQSLCTFLIDKFAVGRLDEVDAKTGTLLITHESVKSLNWPTMTMEFVASNDAIARTARPGDAITHSPGLRSTNSMSIGLPALTLSASAGFARRFAAPPSGCTRRGHRYRQSA
jgi:hypothetical protein